MLKANYIKLVVLLIFGTMLQSCEKVIDVNLKEAEPRLVIEGNITSEAGPYFVYLSTSGGYFDNTAIQPVENAVVKISDEDGNSEILNETYPGTYKTQSFIGVEGRTYSINVEAVGETYIASDYLPAKVEIDTLYSKKNTFGGPGPNPPTDYYDIYCTLSDPPATVDYYRFATYVNGTRVWGNFAPYRLLDDELFNGKTFTVTLRRIEAQPGDEVEVELQSIGFNTFEYFRTLNDALSGGGMSSTPYNPISNIDNGALGYFGAYAVDSQSLIIEE